MKKDQVEKIADEATMKLLELLDKGKSEKLTEYLSATELFDEDSSHNMFLISARPPNATHVAGYRVWNKLGRYVKMLFHRFLDKEEKEKEDELITCTTAYISKINQTNSRQLPEFAKAQGDPGVYTDRIKNFLRHKRIRLEYYSSTASVDGMSCGGTIKLIEGLSPAEEFSAIVHELAHEMLHCECEGQWLDKTVRETEAEAVAFIVSQAVGLDTNSFSNDYIQLHQGNRKILIESLDRIHKTASEIIAAIMSL